MAMDEEEERIARHFDDSCCVEYPRRGVERLNRNIWLFLLIELSAKRGFRRRGLSGCIARVRGWQYGARALSLHPTCYTRLENY